MYKVKTYKVDTLANGWYQIIGYIASLFLRYILTDIYFICEKFKYSWLLLQIEIKNSSIV